MCQTNRIHTLLGVRLLAEKEQEDQEARALRVEKLRKEEEDSR